MSLSKSQLAMVLGPLLAGITLAWPMPSLSPEAHRLAAILVWVVIYWVAEPLPLAITGLLGAALCVLTGVAPAPVIFSSFGDPIVFLFIGSFMLAKAMQVHKLDRRIAFAILSNSWVGGSTYRTLWAVGITAWFLAMWMSITACVVMLFPVVRAIAETTRDAAHSKNPGAHHPRYTAGLLLILPYAAAAGAISTPVGTPPNLIGLSLIQREIGVQIGFLSWMTMCLPLAFLLLGLRYLLVLFLFKPEVRELPGQIEIIREKKRALGPWTVGQRNTLIAFGAAVLLWIGPGLLNLPATFQERLSPGVAALLAAGLLFVLPTDWKKSKYTLGWEDAVQIDWGTVLLFGSGIALGRLMIETGLATVIGQHLLKPLLTASPGVLIAGAIGVALVISEIASNTASANMVIPVVIALMPTVNGLPVALAATLAASLGFLLPVSTPSNAVIYSSGSVASKDFLRGGICVDLLSSVVIWAYCVFLLPQLLNSVLSK